MRFFYTRSMPGEPDFTVGPFRSLHEARQFVYHNLVDNRLGPERVADAFARTLILDRPRVHEWSGRTFTITKERS